MEGNARTWFTPKQRAELWERWRSGQCVADIARALARRNKSGVYRVLALHGGIAPTPRPRGPEALSPGAPCGVTMARRAEARAGVVAGADRRLAEAAIPCRPRHAAIARNDLSKSLYSDTRCAEEGADGTPADGAAKPRAARPRADWDRSSMRFRSANGRPRSRTALCPATGKETFSVERTTRTSRRSSSAIRALCCFSRSPAKTRPRWSPRPLNTCADCLLNCAAPGTAARKWLTTRASPLPPKCRFISAIHTVLGRAADALAFALRDPRPRVWQRRFCAVG
jgi:hypothetical protein